jgi:hypothetical protein
MEIRERTIDEIKKLDSNSLSTLYEIVMSMKKSHNGKKKNSLFSYQRVRESLRNVKGSLSEEIVRDRDDRI